MTQEELEYKLQFIQRAETELKRRNDEEEKLKEVA